MKLVTKSEYEDIMPIFNSEMGCLAKHENRNSYFGRIAINLCYTRMLKEDLQLFQIFTPRFQSVIEYDYLNALNESPKCFGTLNAMDVVHALYKQAQKNNYPFSEKRYAESLAKECFCLLICRKEKQFIQDVLRIDLFRKLDRCQKRPEYYEFTGGIFHALKHFSVNEQCASILPNQNISLYDPEQLIWPIAKTFFESDRRCGNKHNTYEADINYLGKILTTVFYQEEGCHISFINTIIPK